jgi:PAS domain S-box-containing protein
MNLEYRQPQQPSSDGSGEPEAAPPPHDSPPAAAPLLRLQHEAARLATELALMRERFDDVVRLVSDWVWETDPDLVLTSISERVIKVLGRLPRELVGRNLLDLARDAGTGQALRQRLLGLAPFRDQLFEAADAAGATRLCLISAVPVFDLASGAHTGFRGTASDITELTERERSLLAAKQAAEKASRTKSHFLANMSHELRTPLNAILGFSDVMRMNLHGPLGDPQYDGYVRDIHSSASHLLEMITDILDLAKIESGQVDLNEEVVAVEMIVAACLPQVRERARTSKIDLRTDLAPDLPLIHVDQRFVRQILLNLLSNAIKFTDTGGAVTLRARVLGADDLQIQVVDSGIGIAEADLSRVLDPFVQGESHHARRYEGTGLGLALSRQLAELHGGRLALASKLGVGTTVTLHLPRSRWHLPT